MDQRFLDALKGENRGRPPVWLMRQAGRYMPQYLKIKERYSFLEMVNTPEVAAEVTLLPIDLLGVDAAILFADILPIVTALGLPLRFEASVGPVIDRPLSSAKDVEALPDLSGEEFLTQIGETVRLLVPELKVPLIGFAGGPFTVASYMIEGGSSKELKKTKRWMYADPQSFALLLEKIADATAAYLNMQIDAGVHAVQLFDSWANTLSHSAFTRFCLPALKRVMRQLRTKTPVILFCRGSSVFAPELATLTPSAISLDWNCDLATMRERIPREIALQGNLDPNVLYAPRGVIREETSQLLSSMEGDPGYIFNLGHGISPDMPLDSVRALVDTVKEKIYA